MAAEPDPFEREILQNCPADASYYYLVRYNQKDEHVRFPSSQALCLRDPFEHPIDCRPGTWLVVYSSDALGNRRVQHIGNRATVQVELQVPAAVREGAPQEGKTTKELVELIAAQAADQDDADEGLKATRIDAKKREIALDIASKEQKVLMRGAMNKEAIEAYTLNRYHRTELHAQVEAMFKFQMLSADMMERNYVLAEKAQEAIGRASEMEKIAAQKIATPPPPPDYTPVLSSVVAAIRDIGVSAMQRDDRKQLKADDSTPPVKAALGDKASDAGTLAAAPSSGGSGAPTDTATSKATSAPIGPTLTATDAPKSLSALAASPKSEPSQNDLLAQLDRMKSELEAERNRNRVLDDLRALPAPRESLAGQPASSRSSSRTSSRSSRGPLPVREPGSLFPRSTSRNERCPCGSGRAYKKCCLRGEPPPSTQSFARGASTPSPIGTARPHPSDASTSSQHESARPHPSRASTSVPSEPARPHSPAASTPSPREPARPQSDSPAKAAAPPALLASADKGAAPSAQTLTEIEGQALHLPDGTLAPGLQELLVNIQAGKLLDDPNEEVPPPLVVQVKQVEAVLVRPPTLDRATARRLLMDGSTLEAFGALLFFNPILRDILLNRRGT